MLNKFSYSNSNQTSSTQNIYSPAPQQQMTPKLRKQLLGTELRLVVRDLSEVQTQQQLDKLEFSLLDVNNHSVYLCSIDLLLKLIH